MSSFKMTSLERRATFSLSFIMSLRLLGLFMVLPLFSLYAHNLVGATPFLIGMALGIYGLTQALLQIPFGALSDRIGRRKIIVLGFLLFGLGSAIAALSHSIFTMILGRALQGAGAVGSTLMAMIADLTRAEQRTKAMAIAGMTIGASFMLAMMVGPLLAAQVNIPALFWLAMMMSILGIILLFTWVPTPPVAHWHNEAEPRLEDFVSLLKMPLLVQLNVGIFLLHAIFTASFIVIPIQLHHLNLAEHQQWFLYVPGLMVAFLLTLPCIIVAEKKKQVKFFFLSGIILLAIAMGLFWLFTNQLWIFSLSLVLFLTAFSLLESFLPSLVSRAAPASRKGTALGMYSCTQFFGIFVGGAFGGWLYGQLGLQNVYLFCVILALVWVTIAVKMNTGEIYGKR